MTKPIGAQFNFDAWDGDGDVALFTVTIRHRDGGQSNPIGRVWEPVKGKGWAASPALRDGARDTRSAEIDRSERWFARRKDAALWLQGFYAGQGRMMLAQKYAGTPLAPVSAQG